MSLSEIIGEKGALVAKLKALDLDREGIQKILNLVFSSVVKTVEEKPLPQTEEVPNALCKIGKLIWAVKKGSEDDEDGEEEAFYSTYRIELLPLLTAYAAKIEKMFVAIRTEAISLLEEGPPESN